MPDPRPNILFIMTDDHAAQAMSCYGSRINETPHLDRIAANGMRLDNCFCTNSICTPSRASILTGTYNHVNGVTTLATPIQNRMVTYNRILGSQGYQTAIFGKWHLGEGRDHQPGGFDAWRVVPGQGRYHNPIFIDADGKREYEGYATDLITDFSLEWLRERDPERPFLLMCHHKAPHRPWDPDQKHAAMYEGEEIPAPETFDDDYATRARAAAAAEMRIADHLGGGDLKEPVPEGLSAEEEKMWKYQRYIKDYLRCVASVDDNVGRLLDYLEDEGLAENTIVVYTSDQGFFLGEHGWYDKRFMYEESLRMPFVIQYPKEIPAGSVCADIVTNVDFAPTFLDYAGTRAPSFMQGRSFRANLRGETPADWPDSMYYRYWMHGSHHNVYAHYGVRTDRYKLIYYYADPLDQVFPDEECNRHDDSRHFEVHDPEWELFDLQQDGNELRNVYHDGEYAGVVRDLRHLLRDWQLEVGDVPYHKEDALP
jgi:arylsulfatase A-like enzyme